MVGGVNTSSLRWGSEELRTRNEGPVARRREMEETLGGGGEV